MTTQAYHLLCAFALGVMSIGCFTWRTLAVHAGNVTAVLAASAVVTIAGVGGTMYLIEHDWAGYAAFSAGSTCVTMLMALYNKLKKQEK